MKETETDFLTNWRTIKVKGDYEGGKRLTGNEKSEGQIR